MIGNGARTGGFGTMDAKGGIGKCVAQCDCVAESSDGFMFPKVCSRLDFDIFFASSLVQDGEIIALLQKYPHWRTSSLYVFLLMWCGFENIFPNPLFIGLLRRRRRFSGADVKFLGRLKKSVMTKRVSLAASSVSGVRAINDGKSPTPSSMSTPTGNELPSLAPYQPFSQRRKSQESRQSSSSRRASSSLSPSRTLERCWSAPHPTYLPPHDRSPDFASLTFSHLFPFVVSICNTTRMKNAVDLG